MENHSPTTVAIATLTLFLVHEVSPEFFGQLGDPYMTVKKKYPYSFLKDKTYAAVNVGSITIRCYQKNNR
jgi:hypothetical protein